MIDFMTSPKHLAAYRTVLNALGPAQWSLSASMLRARSCEQLVSALEEMLADARERNNSGGRVMTAACERALAAVK